MKILNYIFGWKNSINQTFENMSNSSISINGVTYTGGRNVSIINGKVIIDGVDRTPDSKQITIQVTGDVNSIKADACEKITVTGNVGEVISDVGNIEVQGPVSGNVKSDVGNIHVNGNVGGKVKTDVGNIKYIK